MSNPWMLRQSFKMFVAGCHCCRVICGLPVILLSGCKNDVIGSSANGDNAFCYYGCVDTCLMFVWWPPFTVHKAAPVMFRWLANPPRNVAWECVGRLFKMFVTGCHCCRFNIALSLGDELPNTIQGYIYAVDIWLWTSLGTSGQLRARLQRTLNGLT